MFPMPIKREFQPYNNNIINTQEVTLQVSYSSKEGTLSIVPDDLTLP
jgi:hypothetical protein